MSLLKTHNWFTTVWLAHFLSSPLKFHCLLVKIFFFFLTSFVVLSCMPEFPLHLEVWFVQVISHTCVVDIPVPTALRCKNTVAITACIVCVACTCLHLLKSLQLWVQLSESLQRTSPSELRSYSQELCLFLARISVLVPETLMVELLGLLSF